MWGGNDGSVRTARRGRPSLHVPSPAESLGMNEPRALEVKEKAE